MKAKKEGFFTPHITLGELNIYYTLTDHRQETLLIFPDNLHCAQAYEREIEHFAGQYQVLAFDYPGRGQSIHERKYPDELEVDYYGFLADLACHLLMELKLATVIFLVLAAACWPPCILPGSKPHSTTCAASA